MSLTPRILSLAVVLGLGGTAAAASTDSPAVGRALALLQAHGAAARASANDRFVARDVIVDGQGTEHVRFDRTYGGLPVIGGDVVVHSRNGQMTGTSVTQNASLNLSTRASIESSDAIVHAGSEFGGHFVGMPSSTLVIYARGPGAARLAYQVRLRSDDADMTYIVDARNGRILDRWSNIETVSASGTGKSLYAGNVTLTTNSIAGGYEMRDPTRGNGFTINASTGITSGQVYKDSDNSWGNNSSTDAASAASDAQFGIAMTWDFYKNILGRTGIANNGKGASNRVHYGRKFTNAFWSDGCFCMTYGDGNAAYDLGPLVSLDIAGHEMSHGVMSRTAGLIYSGESGGLNEANSDIMGTMVEFYANNTLDTPDYLIGEEIVISNVSQSPDQVALRYMFNPFLDGASPNCYSASLGSLDVHFSSGVANHFYYLLAEGTGAHTYSGVNHTATTCNSSTLAGIGRAKAQKIWYSAVSQYMTSSTNYAGARVATISAANALYGVGSAESRAVAAAWTAVRVP